MQSFRQNKKKEKYSKTVERHQKIVNANVLIHQLRAEI